MLVDLSHPITAGMPVYPGDPDVSVESALTLEDDGVNVALLQLGTHTGTHLDAPAHVIAGGKTVDQLDLDLLDGPATVLTVPNPGSAALAARPIRLVELDWLPEQLTQIVCIATGWDQYFDDGWRTRHPFLDPELAEILWQRGARVLGVDTLNPDPTSEHSVDMPVHEFWLGNDGVIVENLRGLTLLPAQVHMSLLPLNLQGLDGSPVRAVARPI